MWADFEKIEKHYTGNNYTYALIQNEGKIYFQESYNNKKIKEIEFNKIIYWEILKECNHKVLSIWDIKTALTKNNFDIKECELMSIISDLKNEYLLYSNTDYSEVISVINTDLLLH